ncbi:MAG: DUF3388 domain-containing protein [Bacillota bacterium]
MSVYFLEYRIIKNRTGLLGDVASLLGLLNVNILKIASIEGDLRGFLIQINNENQKKIITNSLDSVENIKLCSLRKPALNDFLAMKHGKKIISRKTDIYENKNYYRFQKTDLDLLIDFLSAHLKTKDSCFIGLIGEPRVGKTETAISASVHANKHWQLLSTTLLRKITRTRISDDYLNKDFVFIIDALTTFHRSGAEHIKFIKNMLEKKLLIIIEHPDVLVRESKYTWLDFDFLIEIINPDQSSDDKNRYLHNYSSFDIS